jgi:hypothetical protein
MGFLTIQNYEQLSWGTPIEDSTYYIREVSESSNFYDFICINRISGFSAVIGLKRHGEWDFSMEEWGYSMVWNGQPTIIWVTSDWISDKDNMIRGLKNVIEQHPW